MPVHCIDLCRMINVANTGNNHKSGERETRDSQKNHPARKLDVMGVALQLSAGIEHASHFSMRSVDPETGTNPDDDISF